MGRRYLEKARGLMHRFFVTPDKINKIKENSIVIDGEDFKHLTRVLRVSDHELFEVCDGAGTDYHCKITDRYDDHVVAAIEETMPSVGENPYAMTLFQGLPKGQKLEEIVQKGTECGITRFAPFESTYCVAKVKNAKQAAKKQTRLQRVAYEAAKQSKRGVIPDVTLPLKFDALLTAVADYDLVLFAYEHESQTSFKQEMALQDKTTLQKIAVIVGSEGGFSPEEANALRGAGAVSISLGHRILRTETAGVVIASQLNYALE